MFAEEAQLGKVLVSLNERVKELRCIYQVDELLSDPGQSFDGIFENLLPVIPRGWQFPTVCEVKIKMGNREYKTHDFRLTEWIQVSDIFVEGKYEGRIEVVYTQLIRLQNNSQFLPDEQKLLDTIASRIANFIYLKRLTDKVARLEAIVASEKK
jgi:pyruvate, water dikinase